jgi:hypothetical protein
MLRWKELRATILHLPSFWRRNDCDLYFDLATNVQQSGTAQIAKYRELDGIVVNFPR